MTSQRLEGDARQEEPSVADLRWTRLRDRERVRRREHEPLDHEARVRGRPPRAADLAYFQSQGEGEQAKRGVPRFSSGTTISCMDPEGARALAERIAAGPPQDADRDPKPEARPARSSRKPSQPPRPDSAFEIVYLKPERAARREVRIYVRGPDGHLERCDPRRRAESQRSPQRLPGAQGPRARRSPPSSARTPRGKRTPPS